MIEFGKTLREAREAKGYSVSQIAEMTRLMHQTIEDLEAENFTKIPAPIYGRGFVKLYCEALGIDPKPLIEEYMEIQAGNRTATIRLRNVETAAPKPTPEPEDANPVEDPESGTEPEPPQFSFENTRPLFSRSELPPTAAGTESGEAGEKAASEQFLPRARREFKMPEMNLPPLPRNLWRIGVVVAAALLTLWAAIAAVRALYRATMTPPVAVSAVDAPMAEKLPEPKKDTPEKTAVGTKEKRTAQDIAPLYID